MKKSNYTSNIKRLVTLALFCALAYVAMLFLHIKVGEFLTFDAKDAVITLAGLIYGPLAALILSFTVALIEMITVSDTMFYGFIMNFASTAAFACVCSLIYKYRKNLFGAVVGLVSSVASMTAVMILLNLVVTPFFLKSSVSDVVAMIPTLLLPFNLTKAMLNAALVLIFYKPVKSILQATRMLEHSDNAVGEESKRKAILRSVIVSCVGVAVVVLSVCIFIFVLKGNFTWK